MLYGACFYICTVLVGMMGSLVQMIEDSESRSLENINATENAISAVTKICKYSQGNTYTPSVWPLIMYI